MDNKQENQVRRIKNQYMGKENPKKLDIKELEAAQIARTVKVVNIACINGNYATEAGYKVSDALATESADSLAAQTYTNVVVAKQGNENTEKIKVLVEAISSDKVKNYIKSRYEGGVIPG